MHKGKEGGREEEEKNINNKNKNLTQNIYFKYIYISIRDDYLPIIIILLLQTNLH